MYFRLGFRTYEPRQGPSPRSRHATSPSQRPASTNGLHDRARLGCACYSSPIPASKLSSCPDAPAAVCECRSTCNSIPEFAEPRVPAGPWSRRVADAKSVPDAQCRSDGQCHVACWHASAGSTGANPALGVGGGAEVPLPGTDPDERFSDSGAPKRRRRGEVGKKNTPKGKAQPTVIYAQTWGNVVARTSASA